MSGLPWLRLYAELATDPKIQMLSEVNQRRYIMLLCLRCSNGDETLHDDAVAFQLRISNDDWGESKQVLVEKRLINDDNKPIAWNKRQFVSDSSTARVQRHRSKVKQECNVSVTPPDTDTDTDTDTEKTKTRRFAPPSVFDVSAYCRERNNNVNASELVDHYQANGWMRGKAKIKDWKACVRTWEKSKGNGSTQQYGAHGI